MHVEGGKKHLKTKEKEKRRKPQKDKVDIAINASGVANQNKMLWSTSPLLRHF